MQKLLFLFYIFFVVSACNAEKIHLVNNSKYLVSILYGAKDWEDDSFSDLMWSLARLQRTSWWATAQKKTRIS